MSEDLDDTKPIEVEKKKEVKKEEAPKVGPLSKAEKRAQHNAKYGLKKAEDKKA